MARKPCESKADAATSAVTYGRSSADTGEMEERHSGAIADMGAWCANGVLFYGKSWKQAFIRMLVPSISSGRPNRRQNPSVYVCQCGDSNDEQRAQQSEH